MREIRTSGSEGGGTGNSTGPSYPYLVLKADRERAGRTLRLNGEVGCHERENLLSLYLVE